MKLDEFSWKLFESTGSIDSFLLHNELRLYEYKGADHKYGYGEDQRGYSKTN